VREWLLRSDSAARVLSEEVDMAAMCDGGAERGGRG
jgi:hypothetical protein